MARPSTRNGLAPRLSKAAAMVEVLCVLGGAALIVWTFGDIFQSALVPRAVGDRLRLSFNLRRGLWNIWPALSWKLNPRDEDRREDFLAIFAPFVLILTIFLWSMTLIVGYGLIFYGLRAGLTPRVTSFGEAVYFGGTTLTTIGFGDIAGRSTATRAVSIFAGISGLALFSVTTTYLFALFGAFQSREAFVVTLGARAGVPPSGVNLLAIARYSETADDLPQLMREALTWTALVMESHLAYPALAYFRSSHDYESWLGTLGTLLDASVLLMTTVQGVPSGQARIFYDLGRHAVNDLSRYFHLRGTVRSPGIERHEFEHACDRLAAAGYAVREREEAWRHFAELRTAYAPHLEAMAVHLAIPPLQWVGDRSPLAARAHATSTLPAP